MANKVMVFDTEKRAADYAKKMNKKSRVYKYITFVYPIQYGGNGKKLLVKKVKR